LNTDIINEIRKYLYANGGGTSGVEDVLDNLKQTSLAEENHTYRQPRIPSELKGYLETAIQTPGNQLSRIVEAIVAAKDDLHWRADRGIYYEPGAQVGYEYTEKNMHCELIGPDSADFYSENFRLGIFLLGSRILYRDHIHLAPEFYLALTGPTGWRFDLGEWQDYNSGSMIWNHSNQVHAIRVYDQPFLAVYSWTQDVNGKCKVIPADDWDDLQNDLRMIE